MIFITTYLLIALVVSAVDYLGTGREDLVWSLKVGFSWPAIVMVLVGVLLSGV